jgi:pyruvate formate lyase activating enzyme
MSDVGVKIAGWNKLSFIDFPGMASTVLFFAGCNLKCPYCHNPGIVHDEYPGVEFADVNAYLEKRRDVIEGVVLSGGEPTVYAALPGLADEFRAKGLKIKLDTNGLLPEAVAACRPDYLALDIKTLPSRYAALGCLYNDAEARLLRSIEIVKSMGKNAEIRITAAPGFVDGEVVSYFKSILAGVAKVFIQPFKSGPALLDPGFAKVKPYSVEQLQEFEKLLGPSVGECVIRGNPAKPKNSETS